MGIISNLIQGLSNITRTTRQVTDDILVLEFTIVNACIVGSNDSKTGEWVLIDTGLENSAEFIVENAEKRFGKGSRPSSIILTHGHFDHVGSVIELVNLWDIPVYAHEQEMPYITGKKNYPAGDPTVDEGMVAKMSPAFPHHSINLGYRAVALPHDGTLPGLPLWRYIHTPGHTEGHISLFRDSDGVLIAGDAFTTTKQESFTSVLVQSEEVKGPPAYLTTDWKAAEKSVQTLESLKPSLVIPSHGEPMKRKELSSHLQMLAHHFHEIALPKQGRFVDKH